tara:strand:+ start:739 stop:906 length:168 start_codon:yes stop_codon:yes gene_type:complete
VHVAANGVADEEAGIVLAGDFVSEAPVVGAGVVEEVVVIGQAAEGRVEQGAGERS